MRIFVARVYTLVSRRPLPIVSNDTPAGRFTSAGRSSSSIEISANIALRGEAFGAPEAERENRRIRYVNVRPPPPPHPPSPRAGPRNPRRCL